MATEAQERAAASGAGQQTRMLVIDPARHAAQELAAEMEQMRKEGTQLDKTTPGGRTLRSDGKTFQDAWGNVIEDAPKGGAKGSSKVDPTSPEDIGARLRELDEERTKLLAQQQVATSQQQADAAAVPAGQGSGEQAGESEGKAARKGGAGKKSGRGK